MKYPRGFIDPRRNHFYPNIGLGGHRENAKTIIEERGWLKEWENDSIMCNEAPDFLVFRKGFIQIGSGSEKVILISKPWYVLDLEHTKIWRSIRKSLDSEEIIAINDYKIIPMNMPRF